MTNLEIVKSTYEGKSSEENGRNLAKYVAHNISWTEAKGFPYTATYIGLEEVTMYSPVWVVNGSGTNSRRKTMSPPMTGW